MGKVIPLSGPCYPIWDEKWNPAADHATPRMMRCVCLLAGTAESSQPRPLKKNRWHGLSMPTVPHSAPLAGTANSVDMTFIDKPGRAELSMRHVLFAPCLYHTIWYYVTAECVEVLWHTKLVQLKTIFTVTFRVYIVASRGRETPNPFSARINKPEDMYLPFWTSTTPNLQNGSKIVLRLHIPR